jgi:hypothetical protein
VRLALAAAWLTVSAPLVTACFDGKDALGLPCTNASQCGDGQSCGATGMCVANGDDGSDGNDDGSDDDGTADDTTGNMPQPCLPTPPPSYCMLGTEIANRQVSYSDFAHDEFGHLTAVVAGDFIGDEQIDVAVLSLVESRLHMVSNDGGGNYTLAGSWFDAEAPETYDVIATDSDCDDGTDFIVLSHSGEVTQLRWQDSAFERGGQLFVEPALYSLAAADLIDDDFDLPDLVISGNSHISLVPNYGGAFDPGGIVQVGNSLEFYEPWDTLVIGGRLADARILVPASNDGSFDGASNQVVHVLQATAMPNGFPILAKADPPTLQNNFRNPWAVAAGNLDGDPGGSLEIVVAERNLDGEAESTTLPGTLRFFRLDGDDVTEFLTGGIPIGVGPGSLAVADLDCDGFDDVVIGNGGTAGNYDGVPQVLFGATDLASAMPDNVAMDGMAPGSRMAVGDFDDDGRPEVAIPDYGRDMDEPGNRIVFIDVEEQG